MEPLMAVISPEEAELIRRYLAGSLSQKELEMVETRIVEETEFRNEVELTQALRDGLRELQTRGEIAPLLSPRRRFWLDPRAALAASLAVVALGVASFLFFQRSDEAPLELPTETLRFLATRGAPAAADATWTRAHVSVRLELRFDVGLDPAAAYAVRIERMTDGIAVRTLESTAMVSPEGEAILTIDGAA
ncbi:MAG: hypothetical protein ACT4UQ_12605, partial [Gammaproteobacteria bacterium]